MSAIRRFAAADAPAVAAIVRGLPEYFTPDVATRAFYERNGFVHVDTIDPLPGWPPGNPAAIYVAAFRGTR
jgi:hypothetical protein